MKIPYTEIIARLERIWPGATDDRIAEFVRLSGLNLPCEYLDLLKISNGAEGSPFPGTYLMLWRVEELLELNTGYMVAELVPGLFVFGTDGADTAYAFDTRQAGMPIVATSLSSLLDEPLYVAGSLAELIEDFERVQDAY